REIALERQVCARFGGGYAELDHFTDRTLQRAGCDVDTDRERGGEDPLVARERLADANCGVVLVFERGPREGRERERLRPLVTRMVALMLEQEARAARAQFRVVESIS